MEYELNQIIEFIDEYPEGLYNFVKENNYTLTELEPITRTTSEVIEVDGEQQVQEIDIIVRRVQIVEKHQPTPEEERARLDSLFMTRSDFFDATIRAFGADENDLLVIINSVLGNLPLSDIEKKIALNNYKNALNFYRKHTLFTLLSNVEIPISEQQTIRITSEQWDRFFDTKDYRELLPREEV